MTTAIGKIDLGLELILVPWRRHGVNVIGSAIGSENEVVSSVCPAAKRRGYEIRLNILESATWAKTHAHLSIEKLAVGTEMDHWFQSSTAACRK